MCIKRKRGEQAPDALLLERPGKRQQGGIGEIQYVRQRDKEGGEQENAGTSGIRAMQTEGEVEGQGGDVSARNGASQPEVKERRTFHLKRPAMLEPSNLGGSKRQKRKQDGVATFVERSMQHASVMRSIPDFTKQEMSPGKPYGTTETPLKRPGRRAAVKTHGTGTFPPSAHNAQVESSVANSLHEFAQQVVATEARPHVTAVPKLPPSRSRELHRQSALRNVTKNVDQDGDADMEDEGDYVYDTYILAPSPSDGAVQTTAYDALGNVGYLVITEEDQDVWETYLEDEPSDKDWNSDEEDENAEDWYGADYPDEELASDDEFGRGNDHGFRAHGAADDEEWDEDTGNFSDEEYDRQMHPWKKMSSLS